MNTDPILHGYITGLRDEIAEQAAEIARLRGQRQKTLAHCYASDDGTEYEHEHGPSDGYPECPACWAADIRATLGENR